MTATNSNQVDDIKVRMQLAETSFKSVLDSNIHEDNKAGRILSAMAFLTAAAAGIFNIAYSRNSSTKTLEQVLTPYVSKPKLLSAVNDVAGILQKPELIPGLSTPILAFSAYILFVLTGSVFYLKALGPSFNWPSKSEKGKDLSLLFFKGIVAQENTWGEYWDIKTPDARATNEKIQNQLLSNYINECMLIAKKEKIKVERMMVGSQLFISAIFFLAVLTATLILPDIIVQLSFWVLLISISVYFLILLWPFLQKKVLSLRPGLQEELSPPSSSPPGTNEPPSQNPEGKE